MWEEWEDFQTSNSPTAPTAKLQLFVESGGTSSSLIAADTAVNTLQLHNAFSIQSQPSTPSAVTNRQQQQSAGDHFEPTGSSTGTPLAAAAAGGGAEETVEELTAGLVLEDPLAIPEGGCDFACRGAVVGVEFLQGFAGSADFQQNPTEADCHTDEDIFLTVTENLPTAASLVSGAAAAAAAGASGSPQGDGAYGSRGWVAATAGSRHLGDFDFCRRGSSNTPTAVQHPAVVGLREIDAVRTDFPGANLLLPGGSSSNGSSSSSSARGAAGSAAAAGQQGPGAAAAASVLFGIDTSGQQQQQQQQQQHDVALRELELSFRGRVEVLSAEQLVVVRYIGGGAFGEVFLARWKGTEVGVTGFDFRGCVRSSCFFYFFLVDICDWWGERGACSMLFHYCDMPLYPRC
jgi:hypothetical protein